MNFSERLKMIRQESNLTQEDLAKKLFVSRQAVSNYEQGKGYPSMDTLVKISNLFNISLDELLDSTAKSRYTKHSIVLLCEFALSIFIGLISQFFILSNTPNESYVVPVLLAQIYILPTVGGIVGLLFQVHPPKTNYFFGFRTKASMKNPTVWNYAQVNIGVTISVAAVIALVVVNMFAIIAIFLPFKVFLFSTLVVIVLQLSIFIVPAIVTAKKLKEFT